MTFFFRTKEKFCKFVFTIHTRQHSIQISVRCALDVTVELRTSNERYVCVGIVSRENVSFVKPTILRKKFLPTYPRERKKCCDKELIIILFYLRIGREKFDFSRLNKSTRFVRAWTLAFIYYTNLIRTRHDCNYHKSRWLDGRRLF